MCGIIGVFNNSNAAVLVKTGLKLMSHRGINGSNVIKDNNYALGHCLHSVVGDIKQPVGSKNLFLANCEIYNWRELAERFSLYGNNDAELFYSLIEKFGIDSSLNLVDGDYACAYLRGCELYLFRDIFGVKPLWFSTEKGFVFASEKKILEKLGYNFVKDLGPRKILVYNTKNRRVKFIERAFFDLKQLTLAYKKIRKDVQGLLINAIAKRVPDCRFGLLFSGGVDSAFIALVLKQLGIDFNCYICVVDEKYFSLPKDLEYSKKVASTLGLKLNIVKVKLKDVETEILRVVNIIESTNVTKLGVALPFYFACKNAKEDGCKVIFSGLGSEEIFAGYERHNASLDLNKECRSGLLWIYERDLYRDDTITMVNSIELRVPFLDRALVDYALKIPPQFKIKDGVNKFILRDIAMVIGLDKEFAFRKKMAAQYGSNFDKAIGKLARANGCRTKSEYVNRFYNKPNLKLGVLFSGGKDSCYAMHVMARQNYKIECLISIKSKNDNSFMFHTPNIDFVKYQAKAMGLPLVTGLTSGREEAELVDLEKVLVEAVKKYKIQGVVTGALFSSYQRDRIEKICEHLGLKAFSPLWHKGQLEELKEIVKEGFEVVVVKFAADGFDKNWLGKKIDNRAILDLERLNKKFGINAAAEGGEYETFVLDAPMFKKRIEIIEADIKVLDNHSGIYLIKDAKIVNKD